MGRETGGVVVALVGVVLLIAAINGTLGNVWHALVTDTSRTTADPTGPAIPGPHATTGVAPTNPGAVLSPGEPGSGVTIT